MLKSPLGATIVALLLAFAVNAYFYVTGTDLTIVVSRTLFANMLIVLSLVPMAEALSVRSAEAPLPDTAVRIKNSMKTVALYVIILAVLTAILFSLFAEPLVAGKLNDIANQAKLFVENGDITQEQADERLLGMEKFYSIGVYLPVLILTNLMVGFVSSIPAVILIRK